MELEVGGGRAYAHTGGVPFDPAGRVVVFVHGAGMDHSVWRFQARALAHHGFAVAALDLRGHGRSEGHPAETVEEYARWVVAFLAAAGVVTAAVVGHSIGSLIGIEVAATHPERVSRLALIAAGTAMPVHPDLQGAADRNDPIAYQLITGWSYGIDGHLGGHPQPGTWVVGGTTRLLERSRPGVLAADLRACQAYTAAEAAARIRCPTLIVAGTDDKMVPVGAVTDLSACIAGARLEVVARGGHQVMSEHPEVVRRLLTGFLA